MCCPCEPDTGWVGLLLVLLVVVGLVRSCEQDNDKDTKPSSVSPSNPLEHQGAEGVEGNRPGMQREPFEGLEEELQRRMKERTIEERLWKMKEELNGGP